MNLTPLRTKLKPSGLKKRYLNERNKRTAQRIQAIYLRAIGKTPVEIAKILVRNVNTIRRWIKQFNDEGLAGLEYKHTGGKRRKLTAEIEQELLRLADSPNPEGRRWTLRLLSEELRRRYGIKSSESQVWQSLKRLGKKPHRRR